MQEAALANAGLWAERLEIVADIAFAIVIIALLVELVSGRIAKHFRAELDGARELQLATLQKEAAVATYRANESALALAELQKKLKPRWLPTEQQVDLMNVAKQFPGMVAHFWIYPEGAPDAYFFAMGLEGNLRDGAGWRTASWVSQSGHPSIGGLLITWRAGSAANKAAAEAIGKVLTAANIAWLPGGEFEQDDKTLGPEGEPATPVPGNTNPSPATIRIFVGQKPP